MICYVVVLFFLRSVVARITDPSCGVVAMEQWNGEGSLRTFPLDLPVTLVVVQHTVTQSCDTDDECKDIVKRIRSYHVDQLNWTDIGQSFLVDGNGVIYEGAGWKIGAHTFGYNNRSIGISFIGDFRTILPTKAALEAVKYMLDCSVKRNRLSEDYDLIAHSQVSNTESPGAALANQIRGWTHWVEQLIL